METVKRIIDWLSDEAADTAPEPMAEDIVFEINTLEDAARIAMAFN
ncbi:MAG: hypothetical protein U1E67_01280 [Hyphomicrobiales bacterium]